MPLLFAIVQSMNSCIMISWPYHKTEAFIIDGNLWLFYRQNVTYPKAAHKDRNEIILARHTTGKHSTKSRLGRIYFNRVTRLEHNLCFLIAV